MGSSRFNSFSSSIVGDIGIWLKCTIQWTLESWIMEIMKEHLFFFFFPKEYSIFLCSTSINVTIRKNLPEIILLPKFTPGCGESWKALVNGHHQVDNRGYTFPKQSSFIELTAQ